MRVGLIAPPFITIPPKTYGGVELFLDILARYLTAAGVEVVLYSNGESTVNVENRYVFPKAEWPVESLLHKGLKEIHHTVWAVEDASRTCDVIHLNSPVGPTLSLFTKRPIVCTVHHPHVGFIRDHYHRNEAVKYVTLSKLQQRQELPLDSSVIYHGLDLASYRPTEKKQRYLAWLARISPIKGTHLAIECAKRLNIPLKIAGDLQPDYRAYFEEKVKPHIDGEFIKYVGEVDLQQKIDLLGNAAALLFPVDWEEPFGLVMIEAMACGTPVVALDRGAVPEVIEDGVSGLICKSLDEIVARFESVRKLDPRAIRVYVERRFSAAKMTNDYVHLYEHVLQHAPPASKVFLESNSGSSLSKTFQMAHAVTRSMF
jgi:glycosyltransferase involved in cell wall biosynthesis